MNIHRDKDCLLCFRLKTKSSKKLSAVRKVPEAQLFQAHGIIESKTVWETVLAWAQKLRSEEAQN